MVCWNFVWILLHRRTSELYTRRSIYCTFHGYICCRLFDIVCGTLWNNSRFMDLRFKTFLTGYSTYGRFWYPSVVAFLLDIHGTILYNNRFNFWFTRLSTIEISRLYISVVDELAGFCVSILISALYSDRCHSTSAQNSRNVSSGLWKPKFYNYPSSKHLFF